LGLWQVSQDFCPSSEHGLYKAAKATIISWEGATFSNDSSDHGEADPKQQRTIHHDWGTIGGLQPL